MIYINHTIIGNYLFVNLTSANAPFHLYKLQE